MPVLSRSRLSDSALVRAAVQRIRDEARLTAEHLADLAEIDARKAWRAEAFSSLLDFCIRGLRLSDDEAKFRIRVARVVRRFPALLDAIAEGRLRMTSVVLLAPRLTDENAADLVAAACGRTKDELLDLLAARFPRADVPDRVEPLLGAPDVQELSGEVVPEPLFGSGAVATDAEGESEAPAGSGTALDTLALFSPPAGALGPRTKVAPLSAGSYALQGTIRRRTHERMEYAKALLGRGVGRGDLDELLYRALDALIRQLERRKYGIVDRPRRRPIRRNTNPRHVPAAVRRAVVARDGGRCTFVSDSGRRCGAREHLEFDHAVPVARGGEATVSNLRLRCRAHNQLAAEQEFGAEFMRRKRAAARETARASARETAGEATAACGHSGAVGEVVPWLRQLMLGKEESRRAAEAACRELPGAPLEARVRRALGSLARSRPVPPFGAAAAAT